VTRTSKADEGKATMLKIVGEAVRLKAPSFFFGRTAILPGDGVSGKKLQGRPR